MFKCGSCGTQQPKGTKTQSVVVETRNVEYKDTNGKVIGKGWETVREVKACPACAKEA